MFPKNIKEIAFESRAYWEKEYDTRLDIKSIISLSNKQIVICTHRLEDLVWDNQRFRVATKDLRGLDNGEDYFFTGFTSYFRSSEFGVVGQNL